MEVMMLRVAVALIVISSTLSFVLKHDDPEIPAFPTTTNKTWDFSACAPGIKLTLGGKVLNRKNLSLTTSDEVKLAPLLHDETLEDRMYVWCKLATVEAKTFKVHGVKTAEMDVEQLDLFEGDIVLGRQTVDMLFGDVDEKPGSDSENNHTSKLKRSAPVYERFYWDGEIRWQFSPTGFDFSLKTKIRQAFNFIQSNTCVRFREFPSSPFLRGPHIRIINGNRCYAEVGRQGLLGQIMSITESCSQPGTIQHEIGHELGLLHEHTRPDRDLYVTINMSNILNGAVYQNLVKGMGNFTATTTLGIPYDLSSAMHYSARAFSGNGLPTINPKDPNMEQVLGQRESLSFLDVKFINFLYKCQDKCGKNSLEWNFCHNGGYRDPNNCNQCKCPPGFAPPSCSQTASPVNADCGKTEVLATAEEQSLASPRYPSGYPGSAECAWLIRAPPNQRLRLQFKGIFDVQPDPLICRGYVEVRYKDIARTGPRFCRNKVPTDVFVSHGEEALILLHTKNSGHKGFSLSYKAEKCGGCTLDTALAEPVCFKTEEYSCPVSVTGICGNRYCTQQRKSTCIRESSYCCPGYEKSGGVCKRRQGIVFPVIAEPTTTTTTSTPEPFLWGPWGAWSGCSATCGDGAMSIRTRTCLREICEGTANQGILCGPRSCPVG